MTKTIVSGTVPHYVKKVVGEGYTAEYVTGRDDIYKKIDEKTKEFYEATDQSEWERIDKERNELYASLNTANITSGYVITFDELEKCEIFCQAWEYDDAITCVTYGAGKNMIMVTTLNTEGTVVPTSFSFLAVSSEKQPEYEYK